MKINVNRTMKNYNKHSNINIYDYNINNIINNINYLVVKQTPRRTQCNAYNLESEDWRGIDVM